MRDREKAETQAQGEAGSSQGTYVELGPGTPGSRPEPKAGAQLLNHPGVPLPKYLILYLSRRA